MNKLIFQSIFFLFCLSTITLVRAQNCGIVTSYSINGSTLTVFVDPTSGGSKGVIVTVRCGQTVISNGTCQTTNQTINIGTCNPSSISVSYNGYTTANCNGTTCTNPPNQSVLPIELISFTSSKNKNHVELNWITASETNNDYFTIERSGDGQSFDAIGEIDGAGNSNREIRYEFIDEKPLPGVNYYRIKQTDYDGQYSYSEIRSVRFGSLSAIQVSSHTTEGRLTITTTLENYSVTIINAAGQMMKKYSSLSFDQTIDIEDLHSGLYFIRVSSGSDVETTRVIKIW